MPHAKDVLRLARERHQIVGVVEDLAEKEGTHWQARTPAIAMAYVPGDASPAALVDTINMFESVLSPDSPLPITLLPPTPPKQ